MSIRIFYDENGFRYRGWRKLKKTLEILIKKSGKTPGDINIIITGDEELRKINISFLEHDYYTDVITFNYNSEKEVNGEIYLSIDTVKNNASNYKVSLNQEVTRVIIHGALHLLGHDDKTGEQRNVMRNLEDYWIGRSEKE